MRSIPKDCIQKGGEIMRKIAILTLMVMLIALAATGVAVAGKTTPPPPSDYIVIPVAEGGMKCMLKKDYSEFCIMPPGYDMRVQVFKTGKSDGVYDLVTSGITVEYAIEKNTFSQNGTPSKTNFWTYASNFGWNLTMDTGTKGYKLSGTMAKTADGLGYEALKVPQTPFLDGTNTSETPYQNGVVTVKNASTGAVLVTQKFVMPASTEMMCKDCHGGDGGVTTDRAILQAHDRNHGTTLATDGKANLCADCHADPSIGKAGNGQQKYLSTSMHSFHSSRMSGVRYKPICYTCHPGPTVKCNRGVMSAKGKSCDNTSCHGSMANVGSSSRTPWSASGLPKCANCHSAIYAENAGKKFKDSILTNGPAAAMNGIMYCQTCHGAQHAEWPSTKAADNQVPLAVQGTSDMIGHTGSACKTCHNTSAFTTGFVHK